MHHDTRVLVPARGQFTRAEVRTKPENIEKFFEMFPDQLIRYVQVAKQRGFSVVGIHLVQLARLAKFPLMFRGKEIKAISSNVFVKPNRFDNITQLLSIAGSLARSSRNIH